jgi:hypothetical protein
MYGTRTGLATGPGLVAALPYTGLNVVWLVLAAVTLITTGIAIVRLARR